MKRKREWNAVGARRGGWLKALCARGFFVSYLMVALPVLLATNLLFYLLFVPMYQRDVEQMNTDLVVNAKRTFDHEVRQPLERLYLDVVLYGEPYGVLYPLSGGRLDDVWKLYQGHQYMKTLATGAGSMLTDVGVYYHGSRFVSSSVGYFSADNTDALNYPDWANMLDFRREGVWRANTEEKRYSVLSPATQNVVYCMRNFPIGSDEARRRMTIVFTLSRDYLSDLMARQIGMEECGIAVTNASGEALFGARSESVALDTLPSSIYSETGGAQTYRINGRMVTVLPSEQQDLFFVFSMPSRHYFQRTDQVKMQLMLLALVALVLALISSKVISRFMYSPIERIAQVAGRALRTVGKDTGDGKDGYTSIHNALEALTSRVQDLNGMLEAHRPSLRVNFYRDMLFSNRMGGGAVEERMEMLGIAPAPCYRVFMLRFIGVIRDASFTELFKVKMLEFISARSAPDLDLFVTLHGEDNLIAVAAYDGEERFDALMADVASQLWNDAQKSSVLVAAGGRQEDILGLRVSLREAYSAINYGLLYPSRVLRYEDFAAYEASEALLPCAQGDGLFTLVNDLSVPQAETHAAAYVRALHEQLYAQPLSYRYLRFTLLDILVTLIAIVQKRGVFIDNLYERNVFERYEQVRTLADYEKLLADVLAELTARISLKRGNANYDTVTLVQRYVQEHLGEELSLRLVAERFHISYSHMSKTFKEISGMNFTEYVLQCRLEESIHLLLETNLSLDAIAERVAIYNAGYYIRTFKAKYGMTPKQYRLAHNREE